MVQKTSRNKRQRVKKAVYSEDTAEAGAEVNNNVMLETEDIWHMVCKKLLESVNKNKPIYNASQTQQEFNVYDYIWVTSAIREYKDLKTMQPGWFDPY